MLSNKQSLPPIIQITEDGSHTLYMPEMNEHYHSTHGAMQESMHVFIREGLLHRLSLRSSALGETSEQPETGKKQQLLFPEHPLQARREINLLEIGFGTGLNAFLTLLETEKANVNICYLSIERYPITCEAAQKLNYPAHNFIDVKAGDLQALFLRLHTSPWEQAITLTPGFTLLKQQTDFSRPATFIPERGFDLIYYDAFAPDKQPEMWTQDIFNHLYNLSNRDAILTTYCAKGMVRRMLQTAGFQVERLPGPPGKREILRATKL